MKDRSNLYISNSLHKGLNLKVVDSKQSENSDLFLDIIGDEEYISDHIIGSKKILPGSTYIEAICEATEILGYGKVKKILSTIWIQPFINNQKLKKLQIKSSIDENNDLIHFELFSYNDDGNRITHVQSKVLITKNLDFSKDNIFNVEAIQKRCTYVISREECYSVFNKIGLHYGSNFKTISFLKYNSNEAISRIEIPYNLRKNVDDFYIHPSLLDGAFQSVIGLIGVDIDTTFVPYTFKSIEFHGKLRDACFVYITNAENSHRKNSQVKKFNIIITDEDGNNFVRVHEFCINVFKTEKRNQISEHKSPLILYSTIRDEIISEKQDPLTGPIMIFHSSDSLSEIIESQLSIKASEINVINVRPSNRYNKITNKDFEINIDNAKDYLTLIDYLKKEELIPQRIIIIPNYENINNGEFKDILCRLVLLTQAIMNVNIQNEICIYSVGINLKGIDRAFHLALEGFNKTLTLERKNITCLCIEIQYGKQDSNNMNKVANLIIDELSENYKNKNLIIIKEGKRFVIKNQKVQFSNNNSEIPLRYKGTYIITGGIGEIGYIFAQYLANKYKANIVLTGRSTMSVKIFDRVEILESLGSNVIYIKGDVSVKEDADRIISQTKSQFGNIHGIIHSAGIIRDSFIAKKTLEEIEMVLAPKIKGTINLDEITKNENIELFIMFSSATSIIGNIGQSDYAYANSFMNHFAEFRENLRKIGKRKGKTISINWPIWAEGGMKIDDSFLQMIENKTGIKALSTRMALDAFEQILISGEKCIGVVVGNEAKIVKTFDISDMNNKFISSSDVEREMSQNSFMKLSEKGFKEKACEDLLDIFSGLFKVDTNQLDINTDLVEFGFSSIMIMNFLNILEGKYHETIEPNEILHIRTIDEFADFITERGFIQHTKGLIDNKFEQEITDEIPTTHNDEFINTVDANSIVDLKLETKKQSIANNDKKVAIIGMSCKFPKANNIEAYWNNLINGVDAIIEIPKDRFDINGMYNEDKSAPYRSYSKWGGFIDDLYSFDADFFNISQQDAAVMDPKQRIVLELAQEVIENAGYSKEELKGSCTSVYLGAGESSYATNKMSLIPEAQLKAAVVSLIPNMISARISDYYDLKGDSLNIDTACSSSLVAIHYGVKSILSGEVDYSIVGGVDLITDSFPFIAFSKAGVLSHDGTSYIFDKKANGFVIGEGAGLILLKEYTAAIKDGDQILGIISGSAVNNDGKTVGTTVPNQDAQQDVICKALDIAGISAESISYFEAHGTGTLLGDPIEIKAASLAFKKYTNKKQFCAIGSVKSNIGHLQRAAGVAGIIKIIMALNNKSIPATLHCTEPHPRFKFSETPFYPITKTKNWMPQNGRRCAGISSFGFGGTNCHMILEEFTAPTFYIQKRYPHPRTKFNKQECRLGILSEENSTFYKTMDDKGNDNRLLEEQHIVKKQTNNINELKTCIEEYLINKVTHLIEDSEINKVDINKNFMDMGIDSVQLVRLTEEISQELNIELYPTIFFEYLNGKEMSQYLFDTWESSLASIDIFNNKKKNKLDTLESEFYSENNSDSDSDKKGCNKETSTNTHSSFIENSNERDIAIIGMSGLFAGSSDLDSFWKNMIDQENLMREIPKDRFDYSLWYDSNSQKQDKIYCKWGSFINDAEKFDSDFFNISRREAEVMDPQLRKLLQVLYHTTEDAGYASRIRGTNTGIYVGACYRDFFHEMGCSKQNIEIYDGTGNALTMLANRPSFYFNLKGPSISIDTACSSSLVALHLAIKAIRDKECDMAYVAGTNLILSPWRYRYFCTIGALSATGRCHTFDEQADGYVPGEAVAAILLKPLSKAIKDGDRIHAVVKGTAVNSGGYTSSITAPSVNLEKEVIDKAWKDANINPETIGYIEAHGTGTQLGDPIEIEAINKAFIPYTKKVSFCPVGSVKANIGHAEGAAGIAGIIKTVLVMKNKKIPVMPMFNKLNPYIKLDDSPIFINKEIIEWKSNNSNPFRAGVSAFGFGGTYAHTVLEEYATQKEEFIYHEKCPRIIVISAKNKNLLKQQISRILHWTKSIKKDEQIILRQNFTHDALSLIYTELENEIKQYISNILAININDIAGDETSEDLGMDTIKRIEILTIINNKYNTDIPIKLFQQTDSISDLTKKIISEHKEEIAKKINFNYTGTIIEEFASKNLDELAWTLQSGREEMSERLAFVVSSWSELIEFLTKLTNSFFETDKIFIGSVNKEELFDQTKEYNITNLIKNKNFNEIAKLWTKGFIIDWSILYDKKPSLIYVPCYPFEEKKFGLRPSEFDKDFSQLKQNNIEEQIKDNEDTSSTLSKYIFHEVLKQDNSFANEHIINNKRILPGAVCIEMMRAAAESVENKTVKRISNVSFLQPIEIESKDIILRIEMSTKKNYYDCEIFTSKENSNHFIYTRSNIQMEVISEKTTLKRLDIKKNLYSFDSLLSGENIYKQFSEMGFKIGKTHQTLDEIYFNDNKGLAKLSLPKMSDVTNYYLNPLLLDGAFHAVLALTHSNSPMYLFQIGDILIEGPIPNSCWVYIEINKQINISSIDVFLQICDEDGNVLVTMKNIEGRDISPNYQTYSYINNIPKPNISGYLLHEDELINDQDISNIVSVLFNKYAQEEASVARKHIAPWVFISSQKDCFAFLNKNKNILVMFNYIGPEERYEEFLSEIMQFSESISLEFELITNRKINYILNKPLLVTNFAAIQSITNIDRFSLKGNERKRLRYLVSKFQKAGVCRLDEYLPSSIASIDLKILSIIDDWCYSKKAVNSYIKRIKDQIKNGTIDNCFRFFLTYINEEIVNVIIITKMPAGGYLMDMEFYKTDMPLGGLEYGISEIISKLVLEGETVLSLGVTWGIYKEQLEKQDKETIRILTELHMQDIFRGEGNFQFKNKFCPQNFMLYLIHANGNNPSNIEDIIMMIASPDAYPPQLTEVTGKDKSENNREIILKEHGFNSMLIPCKKVEIDFVTDSWAEIESESITKRLTFLQPHINANADIEDIIRNIFPFSNILLTPSGRIAESLLYSSLKIDKTFVPQNLLFPTGLFHQIDNNKTPLEIPIPSTYQIKTDNLFKGNIDCQNLKETLKKNKNEIAYICIELSSNASGGCPTSLQNIKEVRSLVIQEDIPIVIDATRIIENAIFISKHEKGYENMKIWEIINELLRNADYVVASLSKDFSINVGGIIATNDNHVTHHIKSMYTDECKLNDIERKLIGASFTDKEYILSQVEDRMSMTNLLWTLLNEKQIPVASPCGGHCVLLDIKPILNNKELQYPVHSFLNWLFHQTGIRASAHNHGLRKNTALDSMIRLAIPIGTNKNQIETAAILIYNALTKSRIVLKDMIIDAKPLGLFGLAKASFKQID